jgi:hypothetical protein
MFDQWTEGYARTIELLRDHAEKALTNDQSFDEGTLRLYTLTQVMNPVLDVPAKFLLKQYDTVREQLQRDRGLDGLKVVFAHDGGEYRALVREADQARWRSFIDAGADAVVVHHAHVVSDMEIYKGKPIFHGLGNFVFDQTDEVATATAKAVRLRSEGDRVLFETKIARHAVE